MSECMCCQSVTKVWFIKDRSTAIPVSSCTEPRQQETGHSYQHRPRTEGFLHTESITQDTGQQNTNSCNTVTQPNTDRPISIQTSRNQRRVTDRQFTTAAKTSQSSRLLLKCLDTQTDHCFFVAV